jgi:hypothetical protein
MHFSRIKKNEYYVPSKVGPLAKGLIQKLLQHEPTKRPTVAEILRVSCCSSQGCGSVFISSGSGSNTDPDPIQIQGFNDQKLKKKFKLEKI